MDSLSGSMTFWLLIAVLAVVGYIIKERLKDPLLKARFWRKATAQDVEDALDRGASPNTRDETFKCKPLHIAARYGTVPEALEHLIMRGADVYDRDEEEKTPLHWAAEYNKNPEITNLLLKRREREKYTLLDALSAATGGYTKKPLINPVDKKGFTPLHLAVNAKSIEVVKLLSQHMPLEGKDYQGMTALHWAVNARSTEIVTLLLEKGAFTGVQNSKGMSPLHLAAKSGQREIIKLLLDKGASGACLDANEKTPFDYAKEWLSKKSELYQRLNKARFSSRA